MSAPAGSMKVSFRTFDATTDAARQLATEVIEAVDMIVSSGTGMAQSIFVDDAPAGVVALSRDGELFVYLEPAYQRQGIGTLAALRAVRAAQAEGLLRVHARARKGSGGEALARRIGLEVTAYVDDEVFLEKHLDALA